ncbi:MULTISPECIES: cytochrome c553 [Methylobacterium]|jgi:cytochrome subunit of sulfide dehydrogenase|uniref:c-type cytochrome n=2 Tax=Methylobacteriaceae TaxID=119045 RepID=UPI00047E7A6D|nr:MULTISPECIES: cytochrome c553 [Methylobacterium]MBN4095003.1 cytochrome C [Methylobacterium sp. OT2]UIN32616.1 cytochrome C [Methylobacterium oryzae]SEH79601.1 Cytochrome c553 [Methylobacterium sp. 275MFSha3.1]SFS89690.1 Cytochrome c553 [Methylobacterium sp. yr668]
MRAMTPALALLAALAGGTGAGAAEMRPPPGASSCTGCHAEGSAMGVLAGRPEAEIVGALEAFRTGARPATLMNRIAKGFGAQESQAIAAWFAAQGSR